MKNKIVVNIYIDRLADRFKIDSAMNSINVERSITKEFKRLLEAETELMKTIGSCNMTLKARMEQGLREMRLSSFKGVAWSSEAKRVKKDKPKTSPLQALHLRIYRKECEEKYLSLVEQAAVLVKEIELIDSQLK